MATILSQSKTCDGYDVLVLTGGKSYFLHFMSQPSEADLPEAITAFEVRLTEELQREEIEANMEAIESDA